MKKFFQIFLCLLVISCNNDDDSQQPIVGGPTINPSPGEPEYLKDFANYPIGNTVSAAELSSSSNTNMAFKEVLNNEFNSVTAGNDMKMYNMFPAADTYDWSDGDAIVSYAKEHGMRVHGHTLIWHPEYSIPDWLENFSGTDEEFSLQVENYIKATVAHFAEALDDDGNPIVTSWDVVNEAFTSDAEAAIFRQRIGEDYVSKCFQWAREGDPNVKLFYNDYNIAGDPNKRSNIIAMVNDFQTNGIPIDGIGMQMHLNHDWPAPSELQSAIQDIANTGLLVHISELDVKVNYNDDVTELTDERAQAQSDQYQRVAYYYRTIVPPANQYGITIWGVRDQDSWLSDGGTEWPLLYDDNFEPKPAYDGFVEGLKGNAP
ncbi:MAG: endo-1,4-beta-xylanase [Aequorivita sp.]|nr:endo-1,4-beta-xylanase [Aequorivita sp.]